MTITIRRAEPGDYEALHIGIMVRDNWHGQGVGTASKQAAIDLPATG
jgi:hypothetical protein